MVKKKIEVVVKKKKVETVKKEKCTHIDRSNGVLLREKDLNKKKPWLSPVSGQASVEKLTEEELKQL